MASAFQPMQANKLATKKESSFEDEDTGDEDEYKEAGVGIV